MHQRNVKKIYKKVVFFCEFFSIKWGPRVQSHPSLLPPCRPYRHRRVLRRSTAPGPRGPPGSAWPRTPSAGIPGCTRSGPRSRRRTRSRSAGRSAAPAPSCTGCRWCAARLGSGHRQSAQCYSINPNVTLQHPPDTTLW